MAVLEDVSAAEIKDLPDEQRKDYSQDDRDKMAKSGAALPDGSFPIADRQDLANAIQAFGRAKDPAAAKAHIIKRATALGLTSMLPDSWGSSSQKNQTDTSLEQRKAFVEGLLSRRMPERRSIDTGPVEVREADDGKLTLTGYAAVYDRPYDMGMYSEVATRSAFTKTLAEAPAVHFLANHAGLPLASTMNNSLRLKSDNIGLKFEADLDPSDDESQSVVRKVRSGLLSQCSMAFQDLRPTFNEDYTERQLKELSLDRGDVSVVNFGASPTTTIQARGALEDFERRAVAFALEVVESEERAGAKFSAGNLATLKNVLSLVARADTAVDQAQIDLADLIGVKNPDIAQDAKLEQKADDAEVETRDEAVAEVEERDGQIDPVDEVPLPAVPHPLLPDYTQAARAMLARARRA